MIEKLREKYSEMLHNVADSELISSIELGRRDCQELLQVIDIPKHETVSEWEKRTGDNYPDDAPVYVWTVNNPTHEKRWVLKEHCFSKIDKECCKVIIANHHGKPEKETNKK